MISHARFGKLRLARFLPDTELFWVSGWEVMAELWVGEKVAFSEWLRLESDPEVLRSLAIDFAQFPAEAAGAVLRAIDLPLRAGMSFSELRAPLGEPTEGFRFVADRVTYEFVVTGPSRYNVSCTVRDAAGLSYLVVTRA